MKKAIYILLLVLLLGALNFNNLFAVEASAKIDTNHVLIGDQIHLALEVKAGDEKVVWPEILKEIGGMEILKDSGIDTIAGKSGKIYKRALVLTAFDEGDYTIPAFTFMYERQGSTTLYPIKTDSIVVECKTIDNLDSDIRDIKPIKTEPGSIWDYWYWMLLGLAMIIGLILLIMYLRKKKQAPGEITEKEKPKVPKIPAHILANAALDKLDGEKLWQSGKVKEYHVRLTEIVRTYIERRFDINALELTTDEIIDWLGKEYIEPGLIDSLNEVLKLADLSKFAKFNPLEEENMNSIAVSREFVEKTKDINRKMN